MGQDEGVERGAPALGGGAFDEPAGGFALVAGPAFFLGAFAGSLVFDVADREPQQLDDGVVGREVVDLDGVTVVCGNVARERDGHVRVVGPELSPRRRLLDHPPAERTRSLDRQGRRRELLPAARRHAADRRGRVRQFQPLCGPNLDEAGADGGWANGARHGSPPPCPGVPPLRPPQRRCHRPPARRRRSVGTPAASLSPSRGVRRRGRRTRSAGVEQVAVGARHRAIGSGAVPLSHPKPRAAQRGWMAESALAASVP